MAILTKGQTFADGDQVTSAKLNNLVDQATFKTGAGEAADQTTILVDPAGYLKLGTVQSGNIAANAVTTTKIADSTGAADGVTTAKIATGAVTTAKIADANVTAAKIFTGNGTFPIKVAQVVKSDIQSVTGGSWVDVSGLSLAFTRVNATSKVRVQAVVNCTSSQQTDGTSLRIVRTATNIGLPSTAGSRTLATSFSNGGYYNSGGNAVIDFIDDVSAVPTNPITYKLQAFISSGKTGYINRSEPDSDNPVGVRTISTMTLTELA